MHLTSGLLWRFFANLKFFMDIEDILCHWRLYGVPWAYFVKCHLCHVYYLIYVDVILLCFYVDVYFVYVSKYASMLYHIYSFVSKKMCNQFVLKYILVCTDVSWVICFWCHCHNCKVGMWIGTCVFVLWNRSMFSICIVLYLTHRHVDAS